MRPVVVIGVGMHRFGKFLDTSLKELVRVAVWNAINDAGIDPRSIEAAYVGSSMVGLMTGQEAVRGQVVLRYAGFGGIPITNVENACASSSTAFRDAFIAVGAGVHDVVLAVGMEKLYANDLAKSLQALGSASDVEGEGGLGLQFSAVYAMLLRRMMAEHDWTVEDFARVVVKNSYNGSLNPYAQFQKPLPLEKVLSGPVVADPLTLYMVSPLGDGAAAAIICAEEWARRQGCAGLVRVRASAMRSGSWRPYDYQGPTTSALTAQEAYRQAGVGPEDIDVAEVHDAMAPAELKCYEDLGFCAPGESAQLIRKGKTNLDGAIPVNTSGGLAARGHPVGATGLGQIAEIVWQLRGQAGQRQVRRKGGDWPRLGLAHNEGGFVDGDVGISVIHILERVG